MEYQRIMHLIDNTPNQLIKFKARNWVEINDDARGTYNTNNQLNMKASTLKSSIYDYSDAYILVKLLWNYRNTNTGTAAAPNNRKYIIIKNCTPFTGCIGEQYTNK